MRLRIPKSLKQEHEELHAELAKTTKIKGKIGEAAKAVAKTLHPHFLKEEEYALPQLGLLKSLAKGKVTREMASVPEMTDRLKEGLDEMLQEHKEIVSRLKDLVTAAKKEGKMEYALFAKKLMLHARTEEEILYPAAILIGEQIRLKLKK